MMLGVHEEKPADYPDIARQVAEIVARGQAARGVIIDGAGIGSAIVANKFQASAAALCYDKASARNSREHNDSNVLTLGGRLLTASLAEDVLRVWLTTPSRADAMPREYRRSPKSKGRKKLDAAELDRLVEQIGEEILARTGSAASIAASDTLTGIDPSIAGLIDHTLLRADATRMTLSKFAAKRANTISPACASIHIGFASGR